MSNSSGKPKRYQFKAEVSRVLDIVINSLYTDKEIFVRELISNAVDALEKMRHISLTQKESGSDDLPLEIKIDLDEKAGTFTITDTGVGMTFDELKENLGRVAHSGSTEFLEKLAENAQKDLSLIGQFGVGFYAAFMVSDKVTVQTRSHESTGDAFQWVSSGTGGFTVAPVERAERGTSIILELKEAEKQFASLYTVKSIIERYSNFVPVPISLNGEKVNTVQAVWTRNKSDISEEEYREFYKYISGIGGDTFDWLHFSADAPLSIKALLYIPDENPEQFGIGKLDSDVDLHCRKVLIQKQAKDILPVWLRFLKGVVDSEDLPLNISRETMQDSALIRKINQVLTKRFLKFLKDMAKDDESRYQEFWKKFGQFIKEGIISGFEHRDALADLIRFESSRTADGEQVSLAQYLERMPEDQEQIYYIAGSDRQNIESGPYLEVFKRREIEVIYNYEPVDDFVMNHLALYKEKKFVSADSEKLELPKDESADESGETDVKALSNWIRKVLQEKVQDVRESKRLTDSPMILVNPDGHISGAMQRLMKAAGQDAGAATKRILEFNPGHAIIQQINSIRETQPDFAEIALEQLYDHAALGAGIPVETQDLVQRMNRILDSALSDLSK